MRVLGIDAAWTNNQPSGVCLLEVEENRCRVIRIAPSYTGFIDNSMYLHSKPAGSRVNLSSLLAPFTEAGIDCIAVDMPLSGNLITERRSCEHQVSTAYGAKGASTHTPNKERPGKISIDIVNEAESLGYRLSLVGNMVSGKPLIEVYPHTSIIEYLNLDYRFEYKVAKKNQYKSWKLLAPEERTEKLISNMNALLDVFGKRVTNIEDWLPRLHPETKYIGWYLKAYEDMIDALVAALTGVDYMNQKIVGYGGLDGTIWVPQVYSAIKCSLKKYNN